MKKGLGALLGASLALPLAGLAVPAVAQPACGSQYQGAAIQPMAVAEQTQALRLIADANAMFQRMDAEMNAMMAQMNAIAAMPFQLPTPRQLVQAGFGPGQWVNVAPGNGVVFTSISTGSGTCSETITYSYPANSRQPIVHVSQSGNACGAVHVNGPARVQASQPVVPYSIRPTVPVRTSPQPRLWQAVYHHPRVAREG
jgi:hypothetical protein